MQIGRFSEEFFKYTRRSRVKWTITIERNLWGSTRRSTLRIGPEILCQINSYNKAMCSPLRCCGISDLDFQALSVDRCLALNDKDFTTAIAKYIKKGLNRDKRVYIVGLPLARLGRGRSSYNFKFYNRLLPVLEQFGFTKLTDEAYLNRNSRNFVQVLGVQNAPL